MFEAKSGGTTTSPFLRSSLFDLGSDGVYSLAQSHQFGRSGLLVSEGSSATCNLYFVSKRTKSCLRRLVA